ncbi:interactor of HORMAD1 protein 1 isoform 2-T2 [Anomaloglossus baeobatrachus]|uniref:interactor of HORMAD1 protein 1 n=1 Tax=Anomaloglossus baeobatrachus TaxID=238106 RepID=UPI003F500B87
MNLNVWNIKDMFSVPPGAGINKSANRNTAQSDHSSLSDSQFLFSSQFCPDGSQQGSMDYAKYHKNSNQNSQDSEPSIYQKYQAKPPLCSSDPKDRNTFHPFGLSKPKDIIEQFEESKKRAKEKYESEQLHQLICNIQGTLQELKGPFFNIEENTNLRCQSIQDSLNAVVKALQDKMSSYHESLLKVLPLKSDLEQAMLDLEKKIQLKDAEMTDIKSNIKLLLMASDAVKLQLSEKHLELSEKLTRLSDSVQSSEDRILHEIRKNKREPVCHIKDKTTQTSPVCEQELVAPQCKAISPCPDGPSPSPANAPCTCAGITKHQGHPLVRESRSRKTFDVTPAQDSSTDLGVSNDQRRWKNALRRDDKAVTSARNLQHLCQDDSGMSLYHDNSPRNTSLCNERENPVIISRSKGKNNRPKTNKHRRGQKKKRAKNTTGADNLTHAPGNDPVKTTQDCNTFFSQKCGSLSLPVTPAPLRKTKTKNSLKFSLLRSQHIIERPEIKAASEGDGGRFTKPEREPGQYESPSWDGNNPHRDTGSECEEDNMVWFPSSSPLHNERSTLPAQKKGQKDLLSFFFDSSNDSN